LTYKRRLEEAKKIREAKLSNNFETPHSTFTFEELTTNHELVL
jgi:hypothetical protein